MSYVFHRHCHNTLPVIDRGEGVYLFDKQGKQYLDACGGAAVSNLGHSHQAVKQAMLAQIERVPFAHTGFFTSESGEQLAELICQHMPEQFNHVYLVSGGSEAVESALKMARQYFVESGKPEKKYFIARQQSYHGNTLGALSVGGMSGDVNLSGQFFTFTNILRLVTLIAIRKRMSQNGNIHCAQRMS